MSIYTELDYSSQDIDTIEGIQFSVKSAEQIRRDSHVEINKSDAINNNQFVPNGLYDPRMGVTDFNQTCPTCFQKNNFCFVNAEFLLNCISKFAVKICSKSNRNKVKDN